MRIIYHSAIVIFFALYVSAVKAQTKVVVIPLGDTPPIKTQMTFARISNQCLNTGASALFPEITGTPSSSFDTFIDDRNESEPILSFIDSGPTLPLSTSRIIINIFSGEIDNGMTISNVLTTVIGSNNSSNFSGANYDCINENTAILDIGTNFEEEKVEVESITGKTWEITSNLTVRAGVMTLGPTLFQLVE